ncbi:hypothetical protein NIES4075_61390 [Tolypothrix sp. NIES-4075]|uniref:KGK domain-containing protein n=1 Tax=Tolypothrix sp. NIES-4075 TaxID=2005459 RepID=UPI000B5CEF65|nr:KGK domain-containing protein [Tolypothrix sp. NIES-4075]GAX45118.1 hypothetical protein NIES4075_61390 [Tolypothrix sp. NIES-4075]
MEDGFKRLECNDNDVLALANDTFKVNRFKKAVNASFNSSVGRKFIEQLTSQSIHLNMQKLHPKSSDEAWFNEGIDCELLNLGSKAWKKGKVKINITLEFYVEEEEIIEPESPLDDIRRMANEGNF